jgi:DNA-binding CsgD family transcriptional regulator
MALDSELDPPFGARWWPPSLVAVAVFIVVDVWTDWGEGAHPVHMGLELLATVTLVTIAFAMLRRRDARIDTLHADLRRSKSEAERWRTEAQHVLEGLGVAIDGQFERWELTPAEREVALLLLKGLSLKEVAATRQTSERTARDQARSVYRKAGLSGRSELSAFFLEDLLLPPRKPPPS